MFDETEMLKPVQFWYFDLCVPGSKQKMQPQKERFSPFIIMGKW